jgi:hypothetical protein
MHSLGTYRKLNDQAVVDAKKQQTPSPTPAVPEKKE